MKFKLQQLPYEYSALEPYIDAKTMEIHHTKHHQAYIDKLNTLLESHPQLSGKTIEDLLQNIDALPDDIKTSVRNNGGGHYNHSIFWEIMSPNSNISLQRDLAYAIERSFGSFDSFKEIFTREALGRFGSGWVWLIIKGENLDVVSTPNHDNPLMEGKKIIMGLDVWEHAYYLKYQNKRQEYVENWWNVVNWEKVSENYKNALTA